MSGLLVLQMKTHFNGDLVWLYAHSCNMSAHILDITRLSDTLSDTTFMQLNGVSAGGAARQAERIS